MLVQSLRRLVPALALAALAAVPGCESTPVKSGTGNVALQQEDATPFNQIYLQSDVSRNGLTRRWHRQLALSSGEQILNTWRVGDCVFMATNRNVLFSLNASSGVTNWVVDLGANAIKIFRPQISAKNKYVYVTTQGSIFLIDKVTGDVLLQRNLGFSATSDPIVINWENFSEIGIGSADRFYGLFVEPLAGKHWNEPDFGKFFKATPAYSYGGLFICSSGGKIWRIDPVNGGRPSWQDRKVPGEVLAPLTADGSRLLVPCMNRILYSFDAGFGTPQWEAFLDGKLDQQAMIAPKAVLIVGTGKGLFCVNPDNGDVKWTIPGIKSIATRMGDHVMAIDEEGNLLSVVIDNAEIEYKINTTKAGTHALRNDNDSMLYVYTDDGHFACYEKQQ